MKHGAHELMDYKLLKEPHRRSQRVLQWSLLSALAVIVISMFLVHYSEYSPDRVSTGTRSGRGISQRAFEAGLAQCQNLDSPTQILEDETLASIPFKTLAQARDQRLLTNHRKNARFHIKGTSLLKTSSVLFKDANLWDGDGSILEHAYLLIKDGIITQVSSNSISVDSDTTVIDLQGQILTPGIVDMHSHMGVDSWPGFAAREDGNEVKFGANTPFVFSMDGFNPFDTAIDLIHSGGITTSLVLPGSANLMGGEAMAFKHRRVSSNLVAEMTLNYGLEDTDKVPHWRWMKMACGENPRNVYHYTRLGLGYLFRQEMSDATAFKSEQEMWCDKASAIRYNDDPHSFMTTAFPQDVKLETLAALLRGQVKLNMHCYETFDIETVIRHTKQFGFNVTAFHHALEAWQVSDLLAQHNIGAAIFADHWGYKAEAYGTSVFAPKVLNEAGVKVAFKSDHPVLNAQHLVFEAAKANHYGLSRELSIASITSVPATLLGQGWRIGRLLPGFDADLVIWDKDPLSIGAHPLHVYTDGHLTFVHPQTDIRLGNLQSFDQKGLKSMHVKVSPLNLDAVALESCQELTFTNINHLIANKDSKELKDPQAITVKDGIVTFVGPESSIRRSRLHKGCTFDLKDHWVAPGLIAAATHLGINEIEQEAVTSSGTITSELNITYPFAETFGLQVGPENSRELTSALYAGVTVSESIYRSTVLDGSLGTVFHIGAPTFEEAVFETLNEKAFPKIHHYHIGDISRKDTTLSAQLSQVFMDAPVVDDHNVISIICDYVTKTRKAYPSRDLTYTIMGGAEAHTVAKKVGQAGISVLFKPARCIPGSWNTRQCKPTSSTPSAVDILVQNGVNVGFAPREDNLARGQIWEGGWAVADSNISLNGFESAKAAVGYVSWNVAQALGIVDFFGSIEVGRRASFAVYDGPPGQLGPKVVLVLDGGLVYSDTTPY